LHRYDYDKTTTLTERKTAILDEYSYTVYLLLILNVYINLYPKLPPSSHLIIYYQWAHSAIKSIAELSAEWRTFRIAPSICCGSGHHSIERKFFFINFGSTISSFNQVTDYLQLYQCQAVFQQISSDSRLLQVASQWTALLLLRVHIRMQDLRHCLIRLLLVHL